MKDMRGVAAIEFALIAPVFFLLLLGIAAYGIYFSAISSLQELTADAARASVAGISAAERQTIVSSYVTQSSPSYRLLSQHPITVTAASYPGDPTRYSVTLQHRHFQSAAARRDTASCPCLRPSSSARPSSASEAIE